MENASSQNINKKKCEAKVELGKLLEDGLKSIDIGDVLRANSYGCVDCLGFGYKKGNEECEYYKNRRLLEKLQ